MKYLNKYNESEVSIFSQDIKNLIPANLEIVTSNGDFVLKNSDLMINGDLIVEPIRDVREGVGGYYIVEARDLQAAVEIAKECPTYIDGDLVEVRPLGS